MSWDDMAGTWDDDPAVRAYSEAALGSLREVLRARGRSLEGMRVLDFGCGTGLLTAAMAAEAAEVVGFDVSEPMVEVLRAKALPGVVALSGTLADHDLGAFDLVTCSSVLAFVESYDTVVAELLGLLRPGGWLVHWDWELDPAAEEPFGLSREAIAAGLAGAGFDEVLVTTGFEQPFEEMVMRPVMGLGQRGAVVP